MGDIRETLDRSERMLCKGIDEIHEKGDLNASNLELLAEAWDTVKDIYSIREKMGMGSGSYERVPYYMNDGYGARERDSRGRYMNDGYRNDGYRNDGYHYQTGHSMEDEREFLKWKIQTSPNEQEREIYRRKLEQM